MDSCMDVSMYVCVARVYMDVRVCLCVYRCVCRNDRMCVNVCVDE